MKKLIILMLGLLALNSFGQTVTATNLVESSFGSYSYTGGLKYMQDAWTFTVAETVDVETALPTATSFMVELNLWPFYISANPVFYDYTYGDRGDIDSVAFTIFSSYSWSVTESLTIDLSATQIFNFDDGGQWTGQDQGYSSLGINFGWTF